jgi:phage tail-like protein
VTSNYGLPRRFSTGEDAPWSGQFLFSVDGIEIGHFMEVSGLSVSIEEEKIPEGGQNEFVHRLPGRMTWPNLVLKRGVTSSDALFEWFRRSSGEGFSGQQNRLARRTGHLTLLGGLDRPGGKRVTVRRWEFSGAFPVKWSGPTVAVSSRDVATETLEIAHHGFTAN